MKQSPDARYAYCLAIATGLLVVTMVMHPMGGSIEKIQRISTLIMASHSLAILSVPFWLLGFYGLHLRLRDSSILSLAALVMMGLGLIAVMIAAALNGFALPLFVHEYRDAAPGLRDQIRPVVVFNTALNHAFDFIYIGASVLSVLLWSAAIIRAKRMAPWTGWLGVVWVVAIVLLMVTGYSLTSLAGFRVFVAGFGCWTVIMIRVLRNVRPLPAVS